MTRPEYAVSLLQNELEDKLVLEAACGRGDFSLAAAPLARHIYAIDLDDFRLAPGVLEHDKITFQKMDATKTAFPEGTFDTVVVYNAAFHLAEVLPRLISEALRVVRPGGMIAFVSSYGMDKPVISDQLPPLLEGMRYTLTASGPFLCLTFRKPR